MKAYTLYVSRMWPTIFPKPKNVMEGMTHVRTMWNALNEQEKKVRTTFLSML
jgi:hypothetical protein